MLLTWLVKLFQLVRSMHKNISTVFSCSDDVIQSVNKELGASDWLLIDQDRINQFANATGDHQWIHVDPEKAKSGPYGVTIAHGYLTLSLVNYFLPQIIQLEKLSMGINYGVDKVRFPAPVKCGSKIRGVAKTTQIDVINEKAVQATIRVTVEIDGEVKPACIIDTISRYYFE